MESNIVKRSIFRQRTFAKRFEVIHIYGRSLYFNNDGYHIKETEGDLIKEEEIFSCNLEMPMLNAGEKFYIEEKEQLVTIKESYRTSKDSVVYYIESLFVEDDETEKSRLNAEEKLFETNKLKEHVLNLNNLLDEKQNIIDEHKEIINRYRRYFWNRLFIKS